MKMMSKLTFFFLILAGSTITSCSTKAERETDNGETLSSWKLVEERVSIGAAAEFVATERHEVITFLDDSRVRNSSSWCGDVGQTVVTYSAEDGKIQVDCNSTGNHINYEIDGNTMIISNPSCIEVCQYKYRRVAE